MSKFDKLYENLMEGKGKWMAMPKMLARFSGKTYPQIIITPDGKQIVGRDDNGPNPSKSLISDDVSEAGLNDVLRGISKPHPSENDIKKFFSK